MPSRTASVRLRPSPPAPAPRPRAGSGRCARAPPVARRRRISSRAASPACPKGAWPRSWPIAIASTRSSLSASARAVVRDDGRDLERVGQPGAVVVARRGDEDLGLVLQPPERGGVEDPVAVALEGGAEAASGGSGRSRTASRRARGARPERRLSRASGRPGSRPRARAGSGTPTGPRRARGPSPSSRTVPIVTVRRRASGGMAGATTRLPRRRLPSVRAVGAGHAVAPAPSRRRRSRRARASRRACARRRRGTCSRAARRPRGAPGPPARCRGRRPTGPG